MTFDPTKPVRTRAGRPARIIATDMLGSRPIVGLVLMSNQQEMPVYVGPGGQQWPGVETLDDLVNIPTKHRIRGWINVHTREMADRHIFATREEAAECAGKAIGQAYIDIEVELA